MKNTELSESLSELKEVLGRYIDARVDLAKAVFLEKTSKIGTYFLTSITAILLIASLLLLLAFAFSYWYGHNYGEIYIGFLIAAGFYLIIGVVILSFRRKVFTDNIIKNVGKIIFSDESD